MSIRSASEQINQVVAAYTASLDRIAHNGDISEEFRKRQMNQLNQDSLIPVERAVKRLWGDMLELPNGRYTLADNGVVWQAIEGAEKAQFEGRQQFLNHRYTNIGLLEIYAVRVNNALRQSMTGDDFLKAYGAMSQDERTYVQDQGDLLFNGHDGHDWRKAKVKIATDRQAAEDAVFVPLQNAIDTAVLDTYNVALPAGRATSNTPLTLLSQYLNEWQKGVFTKRTPKYLEVTRQEWGGPAVHFANASRVYRPIAQNNSIFKDE